MSIEGEKELPFNAPEREPIREVVRLMGDGRVPHGFDDVPHESQEGEKCPEALSLGRLVHV